MGDYLKIIRSVSKDRMLSMKAIKAFIVLPEKDKLHQV